MAVLNYTPTLCVEVPLHAHSSSATLSRDPMRIKSRYPVAPAA